MQGFVLSVFSGFLWGAWHATPLQMGVGVGAALLNNGGHVISKFFLSRGVPLSYFQRVSHLSNMGNSENTFFYS